jgi:hypothetical protein
MKYYLIYLLLLVTMVLSSCKKDRLFLDEEPPRPPVTFTFTDANGNPPRKGGNTFVIARPSLNGRFAFKVNINSSEGKIIDSVLVEYRYTVLTTDGGSIAYPWVRWDTVQVAATTPSYDFRYEFSIQDLNNNYIGANWITTGSNGARQIARDENETRITAYFKDGTSALSQKLTFTYPVRASGKE